MRKEEKPKVLVGLSGGVDSAVSAYLLLRQGFEVEGVFLKNWSSTAGLIKADCPWMEDRRDALRVAAFLGIPLHTLDLEQDYQRLVMKDFFNEYKKGNTPNPDVLCNEFIKFGLMYKWAMKRGFDFVATGHYAQIGLRAKGTGLSENEKSEIRNQNADLINLALHPTPYTLLRSRDAFKDQTYFLYRIKAEQLSRILFPIGSMRKTEVKKLAKKVGLPVAARKESMGLCFVGKVRLKDFLGQKLKPKRGIVVLLSSDQVMASDEVLRGARQSQSKLAGLLRRSSKPSLLAMTQKHRQVIGYHYGLHNYTIGQRHGINISSPKPLYVVSKDQKKNILYVTDKPEDESLFVKQVKIGKCNWLSDLVLRAKGTGLSENEKSEIRNQEADLINLALHPTPYTLFARFRHQGELISVQIVKLTKQSATVIFQQKQKALASGQSLVLYLGDVCLGGGIITHSSFHD